MPIATAAAVQAITVSPRMHWEVDFFKTVQGGSNIFRYAIGLKFDLAQIEWVIEGLLERRVGLQWCPIGHDMGNLNDCLRLVRDLMAYGQDSIDISNCKAMSVTSKWKIIPFKNFLYGVWSKYTNKCNLAAVNSLEGKKAIKNREVAWREDIEKEVVAARGKIFAGRWINRHNGKPIRLPDNAVFSHTQEFDFNETNPVRMNMLAERISPTSVIDLTIDDGGYDDAADTAAMDVPGEDSDDEEVVNACEQCLSEAPEFFAGYRNIRILRADGSQIEEVEESIEDN